MKKSRVFGAVCASFCLMNLFATPLHATGVSGQGTWETTLQGRDLDGNLTTAEAYYDTVLGITWLADANAAGTTMYWATANAWAAGLDVYGITGWRLPNVSPINGVSFNTNFSNNGTTDSGNATTTTDGTNGGWRDASGNPVSEMGHLFYVTLGNLGDCEPNGGGSSTSCIQQTGFGLSNTGPFSKIQSALYWSGPEFNSISAWLFLFSNGGQGDYYKDSMMFAWAVHDGDVGAAIVPVPSALWLFGTGLLGLISMGRKPAR